MRLEKRLRTLSRQVSILAAIVAPAMAQAGNVLLGPHASNESVQVRFDPATRETRVAGRVAPGLCFSFSLPQEWRSGVEGLRSSSKDAFSDAELDIDLRSARELRRMSQPDLAGRDAAVLQQDYENLLGRPAQSVSLTPFASGAIRWSATWIDANLPAASRAMTIETIIVPLSEEWVLELSLTNIPTREAYNALMQRLLADLRVQIVATC